MQKPRWEIRITIPACMNTEKGLEPAVVVTHHDNPILQFDALILEDVDTQTKPPPMVTHLVPCPPASQQHNPVCFGRLVTKSGQNRSLRTIAVTAQTPSQAYLLGVSGRTNRPKPPSPPSFSCNPYRSRTRARIAFLRRRAASRLFLFRRSLGFSKNRRRLSSLKTPSDAILRFSCEIARARLSPSTFTSSGVKSSVVRRFAMITLVSLQNR